MDRNGLPSEEEQYRIYRQAVEACEGRPITIRTMDIGGDKAVPGLDIPKEDNPFLGMRAIRISLSRPELFKAQIRAILRASAYGTVRIMLPMITRVDEVSAAKALVSECMEGLKASGTPFDSDIKVGIMVETPAAVLVSDLLAKEVARVGPPGQRGGFLQHRNQRPHPVCNGGRPRKLLGIISLQSS